MYFESVRQHKTAFSILSIVVIGLLILSTFLVLQAINRSQDLRQQASVASGQVQVQLMPTQPGQIELGQPSYIDLGIDTNDLQTNGVQLRFELLGNISDFDYQPIANSGFGQPIVNAEITGNEAQLAFLPENITGSFSSSSPRPFLRIFFTPTSPGNVQLVFNAQQSISTVYNSNPPQDELNTIEPIVVNVLAPTPSPTPIPTPSPSVPASPSPSPLASPSPSPSIPASPVPSPIATPSPIASVVPSPTATPSPVASAIPTSSPAATSPTCDNNPDLTGDTKVNLSDYSLLAASFMQTGSVSAGDINCDGQVDIEDYSILSDSFSFQ